MLRVTSLLGNSQRLDGGSMFGNVPRALWSKWCPPDDEGRIDLCCRCFLIEDGDKRILIETGVGAFFSPDLRERYGVLSSEHCLVESLATRGLLPEDIDVVFLSHLHFDHAGGLLTAFREQSPLDLVFPRARYVVGEQALGRAKDPHPRDRASFIPELVPLLEGSGRLEVVPREATTHPALGSRIFLRTSHGHTPGMLIPTFEGTEQSATFCADLIPGLPWVHVPVTMGYDRYPERLIDEKSQLYADLGEGAWLLFTHDFHVAAGRLKREERGRMTATHLTERLVDLDLDTAPGVS